LVGDALRQHHEPVGWHHALLAIGTEGPAGIGDAVTRLDVGDVWADLLDHSGGLGPKTARQRDGIETSPYIDVHVV
jgi:hypothetical protein